jgi:hypothetical protein
VHGRPADGRDAFDANAPKQKVLSPLVAPRVKERHELTTDWIHACEIRAVAEITAVAGQGEIVSVVTPAMLLRNDMLDVVHQAAVLLAEQAILTTVVGSTPDHVPRSGVHR